MARHKLGFDRLETRRMLAADGCEPMTLSYNPPEVADAASPADGALALPAFSPPVRFSRVLEPINGVVHVMHYEWSSVTGDNDDPMILGVSWWTTLPLGQGGGSQESPTDEGAIGGAADAKVENVRGAASDADAQVPVIDGHSEAEAAAILAAGALDSPPPSESPRVEVPDVAIRPTDEVSDDEITYDNKGIWSWIAEEACAGSDPVPVNDDRDGVIAEEIDVGLVASWESKRG